MIDPLTDSQRHILDGIQQSNNAAAEALQSLDKDKAQEALALQRHLISVLADTTNQP